MLNNSSIISKRVNDEIDKGGFTERGFIYSVVTNALNECGFECEQCKDGTNERQDIQIGGEISRVDIEIATACMIGVMTVLRLASANAELKGVSPFKTTS